MSEQSDVQFSAVIPTYNRAALVKRAIESVLAQEYAPAEIIVVDDGSTDETKQVVAAYEGKVTYLHQANAGVSAARNLGVERANSSWIAFLDSDDCWEPGHLARIASAIEGTRGEAALYFADVAVAWEGRASYWSYCGLKVDGMWEMREDAGDWAMLHVQPMMIQACVVSRKAYLDVGGISERVRTREDTLLFYKLAFRFAACAVSGCGTVVNCEDQIRLTQVHNNRTLVYWNSSIRLYRELLLFSGAMGVRRRRYVIRSLGEAYFGMGRFAWREGRYLSAIKNLLVCGFVSPRAFARELKGSVTQGKDSLNDSVSASEISNNAQL